MTPPPSPSIVRIYRRLLGYVRPYRGRLALGIGFSLVCGGSVFALLGLFKDTLASVMNPERSTLAGTLAIAGAFLFVSLVKAAGFYLGIYFVHWVGNKVINDLRQQVFDRMQRLGLAFFGRTQTGDVISRVTNDTAAVQGAVSQTVADLVREPATLLASAAFLVYNNPKLAAISLVIFPVCVLPVVAFGRKVRRYSKQSQQLLGNLVSVVQETVSGIRVVKAFGAEARESAKFAAENDRYFHRQMRVVATRNASQPLMELVSAVAVVAALIYVFHARMPFSDFIAFGAGLIMMYSPAKRLGRVQTTLQTASATAERVFELLDHPIEAADRPGAVELAAPVQSIEFDQVSFAYADKPVLRDIRLSVRPGECIALVGRTGSGKSTLVSLLPRFFDPTAGAVRLNGRDIRDYTLASLRRAYAIVSQDTFLFNDTIAANIAYGDPQPNRDRIEAAARRAQAHDFILQKERGYDTVVGERGVQLSGGQRQRLAIARALYHDAPVLILDEATSALDNESERLVQQAINEVMAGRTVFAIAHRLSTIQHADRILVLEDGQIVEEGRHADLLARNGRYRYYHDLQFAPVPARGNGG